MTTPEIQQHITLRNFNTFGIDAQAHYFYQATNTQQLCNDLSTLKNYKKPLFVLGGGSNILLTGDFDGIVIKMTNRGIDIINEDHDTVTLRIAAGENWHQLVMHCVNNNYSGIENLSLIPGLVGATPIQNIGAYGVELKDVFVELSALEIATGEINTFNAEQCEFGYRNSVFKNQYKNQFIITDVSLRLSKQPVINTSYHGISEQLEKMKIANPTIKDVSDAVISIRQQKLPDPTVIGNAGSFFKNPIIEASLFNQLHQHHPEVPNYIVDDKRYKIPAAWLIEQCGYKGKRIDQIGVHDKQAVVLVNHGNGAGSSIAELAQQIQQTVLDKFNVSLETEVNII
ncbi:MAG: UDP-N-acetylmuramate dehydrogenase [Coxiellaceae bacterium]|nr:UDP-N-acetylmuramate dehydrogenase [Coxiellaceae bacterium]